MDERGGILVRSADGPGTRKLWDVMSDAKYRGTQGMPGGRDKLGDHLLGGTW